MLLKRLPNEVAVRIAEGGAGRCTALEALDFQSGAHGVRMQPQLGGNGANLPVFAMKQASNIGLLFGSDHSFSPPPSVAPQKLSLAATEAANYRRAG
jgi:hypothetical protein